MHSLIVGITTSGKTTLAKQMASSYRRKGRPVLVHDVLLSKWDADFVTDDMSLFMKNAQENHNCMLFIDESSEAIGRYNRETFWLATRSRHQGHVAHFILQRYADINKTVRDQCSRLFTFRISTYDAKCLCDDWANEKLIGASRLDKYVFIYTSRFSQARVYALTLDKGAVEISHGLDSIDSGSSHTLIQ